MKKLNYFSLVTKDNTTCYQGVDKYQYPGKLICTKEELIEKDFLAEVRIECHGEKMIRFAHCSVQGAMDHLKEKYPEEYALIPPFRIDQFQFLADEMKSSSHLTYEDVSGKPDLEYEFGVDPEPDDFIPEMKTVEESLATIKANGFYCGIQCYPNSPVGFWNFYGIDFQSLLDEVIK